MAGEFSRLPYDSCFNVQNLHQTTKLFNEYVFQSYYYENTLKSNAVATCDGKYAHIECNSCDANKNSVDSTRESTLPQRLDDEGSLLGIDRLNTKCDSNKFKSCYLQKCSDSSKSCDYKPIAQPLLCDRAIVQTNMKPYTSGFKFN